VAYRRTRLLLKEREDVKHLRRQRCRAHRCSNCADPKCVRFSLLGKKNVHRGAGSGVNPDGSKQGYAQRLEDLFYLIRSPKSRGEVEPYEGAA
jgi:hypothetical protein